MKEYKTNLLLFVSIILIAILVLIICPFIQIWAVNTLFKTSIEYSWLNWFCVVLLNSSIGAYNIRMKS